MTYAWTLLFDPGMFILILVAMSCILYGSKRSIPIYQEFREEIDENARQMSKFILVLPVMGSCTLVILFFFIGKLYYFLLAMICLAAWMAITFVVFPWVQSALSLCLTNSVNIPIIPGKVAAPLDLLVAVLGGAGLITAWLFTGKWYLTDAIALFLGVAAISSLQLPNLKISLLLLGAFLVYDVFWVFISPLIFGKSVMVSVATSVPNLPLVLLFPRFLSEGFTLLGLGDIVLPGLHLAMLHRFDVAQVSTTGSVSACFGLWGGYFVVAWAGYGIGMVFTLLAVYLLQMGQPALLYLVPCSQFPIVLLAWKRGELRALLGGSQDPRSRDPEAPQEHGEALLLTSRDGVN